MSAIHRLLTTFAITAALFAYVRAEEAGNRASLYKAEVIVTGTGEKERARGFREGLKEIFVKLTGDPLLEDSAKLDPFLNDAARFIGEFTYEDRMKHLPIRDEQGTRDRPHFLRITANPDAMAAAIKDLGLEIWSVRPEIDVLLMVKDFRGNFILAAESTQIETQTLWGWRVASSHYDGYEQREVLKSIAVRRGLTVNLPMAEKMGAGVKPLAELFPLGGASIRFHGELSVLPSGFWRLKAQPWINSPEGVIDAPQCFSFEISEVSFDTALRKSIDAFAAWARRDRNAVSCGLQQKS